MYSKLSLALIVTFLLALHIAAVAAFLLFFSWTMLITSLLCWQLFAVIGISVCYHRQITHRSFTTPYPVLVFHLMCALIAGQAGPALWANVHRMHHRYSDTDRDVHSPTHGFWRAHTGWLFLQDRRRSLPELRTLPRDLSASLTLLLFDRLYYPGVAAVLALLYLIGGMDWLLWLGAFRMTLTLHSAWIINSAGHTWGYQNYDTADNSRNSKLLALITGGEGLHNNHHRHPSSATMAHQKGEFDPGYLYIRLLQRLGLAYNVCIKSGNRSQPAY